VFVLQDCSMFQTFLQILAACISNACTPKSKCATWLVTNVI
jgi:hypothetical protein